MRPNYGDPAPKVVNVRGTDILERTHLFVYVGRPTKWGNPFRLKSERDRGLVLELYAQWLDGDPSAAKLAGRRPPTRQEIRTELGGRNLGCWCAPKPCHADVLLRIANS